MIEGWTIYRFAEDLPFLVKKHYGFGKNVVFEVEPRSFSKTLHGARMSLPKGRGLIRFKRSQYDAPAVIETWLTPSSLEIIRSRISKRRGSA